MDEWDVRVGDADRQRVVELLQVAAGDGVLTLDEFSDRMDATLAARTRRDLAVVTADLPAVAPPDRPRHVAAREPVLPIRATMSSINRSGAWQVPERLVTRSRFASVHLDLTRADVRTRVITIDVDDVCSSTEIVLPDDFTADINGLRCLGGTADSKVGSPPSGRVHVIVRGRVLLGSLTVKHPFGGWLRRYLS